MTQEALKLALEFIENSECGTADLEARIKEALAQTQEPFAWAEFDGEGGYYLSLYENNETYAEDWNKRNPNHIGWVEPIYKHPPQRTWVGLTDEEITGLHHEIKVRLMGTYKTEDIYRAIEAKLKELNT